MIILDTNVLGELARLVSDERVVAWIDRQPRDQLVTTAITVAEMAYGVERMPPGRRRDELARINHEIVSRMAAILSFSQREAPAYGEIVAGAQARGRDLKGFDAQIAAIARLNGAALATRNTKDFEGIGLDLINPWSA